MRWRLVTLFTAEVTISALRYHLIKIGHPVKYKIKTYPASLT